MRENGIIVCVFSVILRSSPRLNPRAALVPRPNIVSAGVRFKNPRSAGRIAIKCARRRRVEIPEALCLRLRQSQSGISCTRI